MLTVKTFDDAPSAHVAAGLLDSEGIPYTMVGQHGRGADAFTPDIFGGVEIQVSGEHFERASELLDVAAPQDLVCPQCGSKELKSRSFLARVLTLVTNVRSVPMLAKRTCAQCEHPFRAY